MATSVNATFVATHRPARKPHCQGHSSEVHGDMRIQKSRSCSPLTKMGAEGGIDQPSLADLVEKKPTEAVTSINALLTSGTSFRELQRQILDAVAQLSPSQARSFLAQCLSCMPIWDPPRTDSAPADASQAREQSKPLSTALPYLVLDCVSALPAPSTEPAQAQVDSSQLGAAELVQRACRAGNAKLATRVASAFGVDSNIISTLPDPELQQGLAAGLTALLEQQLALGKPGLPLAAGLLCQFEALREDVDATQILGDLVASGQEALAERWLTLLSRDEQALYVELCVAADRLKAAGRAVRTFGLRDEFPDVENLYRQRTFARLIEKRLWGVATSFVGTDAALQKELVVALADVDPEQAEALRSLYGLPEELVAEARDPAVRAAREAARDAQYLGLSIPWDNVLFVNDLATLHQASTWLQGATLVGLDAEWRPIGGSGRASLLQVATPTHVCLFDLMPLEEAGLVGPSRGASSNEANNSSSSDAVQPMDIDTSSHNGGQASGRVSKQEAQAYTAALDACLSGVFHNPNCLKLGVELAGDLRKLAGSYPLAAFSQVRGALELRDLWVEYVKATNPNQLRGAAASSAASTDGGGGAVRPQAPGVGGMTFRQVAGAGLSRLAATVLGKPLDKAMQVTDWEQRPLTLKQLKYAAQDAHVLIRLYQEFSRVLPNATALVETKRFDFTAGVPGIHAAAAAPRAQNNSSRKQQGNNLPASGPVASSSPGGQALSGGNNNRYPVTPALGAPLGFSQASSAAPALQPLPPAGGPHHDGGMLLPPGVAVTSAAIPAVGGSASPLDTTVQGSTTGPILSVPTGHPVTTALAAAGLSRAWHWLDDGRGVQGYDTAQGQGITSSEYPLSSIAKSMGLIVTGYDLRPHHQQGPSAGVSEFQMPPGAPGHMAPVLVVLRGDHRIDMYKVSQALGVPRKAVRLATHAECGAMFGYWPGTMPPIGLKAPGTPVLLDTRLQSTCGCGTDEADPARTGAEKADSTMTGTDEADPARTGADSTPHVLRTGSGVAEAILLLTFKELLAVTGGREADVAATPGSNQSLNGMVGSASGDALNSDGQDGEAAGCSGAAAAVGSGGNGSGRAPGERQAFLCDAMLGRLVRWLRCVGVDAELITEPLPRPALIARALQATAKGRVFLTRDQGLVVRRDAAPAAPYLLGSDDPAQQLREVCGRWGISFDPEKAMTRCSNCNAAEFQLIDLEEARQVAPPKVIAAGVTEFFKCAACGKCFWMGPKSEAAMQQMQSLFQSA